MEKKILLLDNDGDLIRLADDMMYYGYSDVHITADYQSVFTIARNVLPDVIILDFLLIDEESIHLCESLKSDKFFKNIPVILISAYQNKKLDISTCNHDGYFTKPFDTEQLASAIHYLVAS